MDCKITVNYLKEKARMSKFDEKLQFCQVECANCPLSSYNNGKDLLCSRLEKEYPEEAVAIVQKWSDEHPQKTYADDFFEKFPNALKGTGGVPRCCRENVYGRVGYDFCNDDLNKCCECWNEIMEVSE